MCGTFFFEKRIGFHGKQGVFFGDFGVFFVFASIFFFDFFSTWFFVGWLKGGNSKL